jgi:hypothetical protein
VGQIAERSLWQEAVGGPPRRRNVLVFEWAVEVIDQYLERSARSTVAMSVPRCG